MSNEPSIIPGQWTLVFTGSGIGSSVSFPNSHFLQSWKPTFRRLTPIAERQNFWSTEVCLDGAYPAQVWEHEFMVYTEAVSVVEYAQRYTDLQSLFMSDPSTLIIQENGSNKIVCGGGYFRAPDLQTPGEALLFRAGFLTVRFLGNKAPEYL